MKKFAILLLTVIAILLVVLLSKMNTRIFQGENTSEKYSNEDIKNLILKGEETLTKEQNLYYEVHSNTAISKYYCKGNKVNILNYFDHYYSCSKLCTSMLSNPDDGGLYLLDHRYKTTKILKTMKLKFGFQKKLLDRLEHHGSYVITFSYIKDEEIEGKDCIFIKENRLNPDTYEIKYPGSSTSVYWIEKSTGFLVGEGSMNENESTATPISIIKNISLGTVQDSDFELPKGYKIE